MDWVIAVGQNLASDAIFVALLIGVGRLIHILTNRRRLLRFFGIQQTKRITIYRSRIGVAEGGAVGVDGHRRSYAGFTTPIGEAQAAAQLMRLFQHPLPSFGEDPPGRLRNLLVADVETVVTDSQESADQLEAISSFISLGSPAYNTASGYAEQVLHSQARFELGRAPPKHDDPVAALEGISQTVATPSTFQLDTDTGDGRTAQARIGTDTSSRTLRKQSVLPSGIPFLRATSLPDDMSPAHPEHVHTAIILDNLKPITDALQGFVERITNKKNGRYVFYVAGISELATQGAAHYQGANWRQLSKTYKDSQFLVVVRVENNDFRQLSVVLEKRVA